MITVLPIHNDNDLQATLERIEALWGSPVGTPAGDELDILLMLVKKYEDVHYPMPDSDAINAIKFQMEQQNLKQKDLIPFIGSASKVSEILNRKRPLSLNMIKQLHKGLNIPYEQLLA